MKWILILFLPLIGFSQEFAAVKSVNFLQEGEVSKLIIDFDNRVIAEKNHLKSDKQIILDIKNVKAERKFLRGIDTSEFSGSTVFVSPYRKPGSANDLRFAIQLRDNVRSFLENKGNRLILNIENRFGVFSRAKLKKAESGLQAAQLTSGSGKINVPKSNKLEDILENLTQSGIKRYVGKRISLNVNSISYVDVLKMIGDTSGFNIIVEEEVAKLEPLSISLVNLPWDQVLDTILDLGELVALKHGNILTITTEVKEKAALKKELAEAEQNKTLEPLVTKIFPISFADLKELQDILKNYLTTNRGDIQADQRTQNIIVKDTVTTIEKIKKLIDTLDTQTPQVLIESKIVEASERYEFKAGLTDGLRIGYNAISDFNFNTLTGRGPAINPTTTTQVGINSAQFDLNTAPSATTPLLNATISVARLTNLAFSLELMESEAKGKVITSPKVITESNKEADITNKVERPFVILNRDAQTGLILPDVERFVAEISLKVTPKVTNEGSILMKVDVKKSGFEESPIPEQPPTLVERNMKTNVLVENGSTIVIGGLYQTEDSEVQSGLPFLKDLPLIGWLFKTAYNPSKERNELIIFLTPRIINQEEAGLVNRELGDDLGL